MGGARSHRFVRHPIYTSMLAFAGHGIHSFVVVALSSSSDSLFHRGGDSRCGLKTICWRRSLGFFCRLQVPRAGLCALPKIAVQPHPETVPWVNAVFRKLVVALPQGKKRPYVQEGT